MSDGTKETDRLLDVAEVLDGLLDVTEETEVVDEFADYVEG